MGVATGIIVREASTDDARLIAELTPAAWAGKVSATSSGRRETAALVAEHLREGGGFVLLVDEMPVGAVR